MSGLYLEKNINCVGLNVNCGFFYFGIRCANVSVQTKKKTIRFLADHLKYCIFFKWINFPLVRYAYHF